MNFEIDSYDHPQIVRISKHKIENGKSSNCEWETFSSVKFRKSSKLKVQLKYVRLRSKLDLFILIWFHVWLHFFDMNWISVC